jgi:cytochrome b561
VATARVMAGTDASHPDGQYSTVAKWFHWITLVLIATALPVGCVLKYLKDEPFATKMVFYAVHESAGLTILLVTLARLGWRIANPPPPLPDHIPAQMRLAANTVHWLLYLGLIVQPVLGFTMTNAFGFPMQGATAYLGVIDIPAVMAENQSLAETLKTLHTWVGYSIAALLVAHIAGAVYHHAIRRDGTLMRML